jgi:hypothetical protein
MLHRVGDSFLPYNSETQVWLVIEDEEEANATYRRMLEDGVTVVDELPDR